MDVEHTLAIIKPEGMANQAEIIKRLKKEGFIILAKRTVHLTPEQVSDFYQDLYGQRDFPLLVATTSVSPVIALCLGRDDAVDKLTEVVGPCDVVSARAEHPQTLNGQFGNVDCNLPAVHASQDLPSARRELHFFFPQIVVEPVRFEQNLQYLEMEVRPLLREGLSKLLKEKPAEPLLWLADWLLRNNPHEPIMAEHLRRMNF